MDNRTTAQPAIARAPEGTLLLADDGELAGRCVDGDRDAFAVHQTRHRDLMYALCLRVTGTREDALDALQGSADPRLARHRQLPARGPVHHLAVPRHRQRAALEEVGRRSRAPEPVGSAVSEQALADDHLRGGSSSRSPEEIVTARLTASAALQQLPPAYRAAVVLREVGGCSYEEIGEILDIPPGTVRSRVARGRQALLDLLTEGPRR